MTLETIATLRRRQVWTHNSHFGKVGMMRVNMLGIIESPTVTREAKEIAVAILRYVPSLNEALKTRVPFK